MAPHDTNTPKEARRHRVPLVGLAVLVLLVVIGFVWWFGYATDGETTGGPGGPVQQTEPAQPEPQG
jgi:ABC-type transporter Mla subunit MlaD